MIRSAVRGVVSFFDLMGKDRVFGLAAETAFFTVVSVFPALLILATTLSRLGAIVGTDVAAQVEAEVVNGLQLVLTSQASGAIDSVRALFENDRSDVLTLSVVAAVVTVSGAFAAVLQALNIAYGVPETRSWLRRRAIGLLMALTSVVVAAVLLTVVVVGPLFGRGQALAEVVGGGQVFATAWDVLRWPLGFVVLVAFATTLCHIAPSIRTRWLYDTPGGLLAAVLWLAASYGFNGYLRIAAGGNPLLGVLGGGIILMTWIYLLCLSLLLGGELNAWMSRRGTTPAPEQLPDRGAATVPALAVDEPV